MTEDERGYYERRAEKQLLMATETNNPQACASHYTLANLYLERVAGDDDCHRQSFLAACRPMKEIANVAARAKVERDHCDRNTDLLGERRDVIDPLIVSLSPPGASCLGRVFSFRERARSHEGG